jgi:hypothetical protein
MRHMVANAWNWLRDNERSIYLEYALIGLAVLLPMLLSGYILTTDMVFTPRLPAPDEVTNAYVFEWALHAFNWILPGDVIQKIILLATLTLSGIGMHQLVRTARFKDTALENYWRWGAYFAGILYMINPFVYSRFMAGQYLVLLGYALLPFFVRSLLKFLADPGPRTALRLAAWVVLISIVSLHHIGIMVLAAVIGLVLAMWHYRSKANYVADAFKWGVLGTAIILAASSYWLLPVFTGNSTISQAVASFDQGSAEAFSTQSGALGTIGNVIRLQGFWLEDRGLFVLPQDQVPLWGLVVLLLWALVGMGIWLGLKKIRFVTLFFAALAIVGVVFATTPLAEWLSKLIPLLSGYREPHKFVNLVAVGYAYLGALGVVALIQRLNDKDVTKTVSTVALTFALLLPLAITPTMLWGFSGQLTPRHYPAEWHAMNSRLNADRQDFNVLFLPWHQYMAFGFSERIIANPAQKFFDKPVVISDDPEYKNAGPTVPNAYNREVERTILSEQTRNSEQWIHNLSSLNIKYVLLAKEYGFEDYRWIDSQDGLQIDYEDELFILYRNTNFQGALP